MNCSRRTRLVFPLACFVMLAGSNGLACSTPLASRSWTASDPTPAVARAVESKEALAGAPGLGDEYYPLLGNGGYDALIYDLKMQVDVANNHVDAVMAIEARALQHLASFNLDFDGLTVDKLEVDGMAAEFRREDGELIIVPVETIPEGSVMRIVITYSGNPAPISDPGVPFSAVGWLTTDSGIYVVSEPSGSSGWYPVNDHPTDKAIYTMSYTVPKPYVAAANGTLIEERDYGDTRTFVWKHPSPMASYLVTLAIADFEVELTDGPDGLPIHNFFHKGISDRARANFGRQGEVISFMAERFGPYPFESCGAIVTDAPIPGALETQTRPIYGRPATDLSVIVHEIAHQWFGNSVTLGQWKDIWLNEGFASYCEWLWTEVHGEAGKFEGRLRGSYDMLVNREVGPAGAPPLEKLFGPSSYVRGGWTLHALRLEVGDETFFKILRTYLERFRDSHAVSADLIALSNEVSGRDLEPLFRSWLYEEEIPAVPQMGLDPGQSRAAFEARREEREQRNAERRKQREEREKAKQDDEQGAEGGC